MPGTLDAKASIFIALSYTPPSAESSSRLRDRDGRIPQTPEYADHGHDIGLPERSVHVPTVPVCASSSFSTPIIACLANPSNTTSSSITRMIFVIYSHYREGDRKGTAERLTLFTRDGATELHDPPREIKKTPKLVW